jgi:hypothetical protein
MWETAAHCLSIISSSGRVSVSIIHAIISPNEYGNICVSFWTVTKQAFQSILCILPFPTPTHLSFECQSDSEAPLSLSFCSSSFVVSQWHLVFSDLRLAAESTAAIMCVYWCHHRVMLSLPLVVSFSAQVAVGTNLDKALGKILLHHPYSWMCYSW